MTPHKNPKAYLIAAIGILLFTLFNNTLLHAQVSASDLTFSTGQTITPVNQVISWDGSNGIAINSLVGADTLYGLGVWGQETVTANVEAGLIWNGHETTSTLSDTYVAPGASGEVDMHATWVGSMLAGYNPNADPNNYPYYQLGMAPLTQLSSGAIATNWYVNVDPATSSTSTAFNITPKTFYSAYNYYFTNTPAHNINYAPGVTFQFNAPTDVINSSWGYTDPTSHVISSGQDSFTQSIDGLSRTHPLTTAVFAAGNNTAASSPNNNVGGPASGFNSITVGAVGNYTATQFNTVADFSSRGPQDYYDPVHGLVQGVRAPVNLVAPGTSLLSAFYGGQTGGNGASLSTTQPDPSLSATNWYSYGLAGTSFAAPIVAGGVSLLKSLSYQAGMTDASRNTLVIKSVLMNSATKLPGWDNGQYVNDSGVTVTTQSLDWLQGAGMLNLNRALNEFYYGTQDVTGTGGGTVQKKGWDLGTIAKSTVAGQTSKNDYVINFTLQGTSILDATLTWFRNVSLPTFVDNADPDQQSLTANDLGFANLDLQIWDANFTHLYASSESQYNNVQELHYTLPSDGDYAIRVTYADQMFGDPVPEDYGLAWDVTDPQVIPEPSICALTALAVLIVLFSRGRIRAKKAA